MDKKFLFKGSSKVLSLGSITKLCNMALKIILARLMGPVGLGIYELVLSITRLGSKIPLLGLHQTIVFYLARFYAQKKESLAIYAIRIGLIIVGLSSAIVGLSIWLLKDTFISVFFSEHAGDWAVIAIALLVPLFSLKVYTSFCYRGMKRPSTEIILNRLCYPTFVLIGLGIFFLGGTTVKITLFLRIAVVAAALPVLWAIMDMGKKLFIPINWFREKVITKQIILYSMPIWLNVMLNVGLMQLDRIFIGAFSTAEELGYYGAAYTFALLLSFIMGSFSPVSQPLMSEAYSKQDFDYLQDIYRTIVDWTAYLIIPLLGGFFLFGKAMLGLVFGEAFRVAYWTLCILGIAQAINALSGPAGNILLMTNHQKISVYSLGTGLVVGIILNIILIPMYGALGAAIGTAISVAVINIIRVWQIKVHLHITNTYLNIFKTLTLVVSSAFIIYLMSGFMDYIVIQIVLYAVLILAGYWFILDIRNIDFKSLTQHD